MVYFEVMKRCSKCKKMRNEGEFYPRRIRGKEALNPMCKACQSSYHKEHYRKNKREYIERARRNTVRYRERIRAIKDVPCMDCGERYPPYVMDFDHLPGRPKIATLGQATRGGWSSEKMKAEIAKCEVVCSNCHRERTHQRSTA